MQIYWDFENLLVVRGLRDNRSIDFKMPARDIVPTSIAVVGRSSVADPFVASQLAAGESLLFTARESLSESENYFYEDSFTYNGDSTDPRYAADVELNTNPLLESLGALSQKIALAEISIVKATRKYYTTRIPITFQNAYGDGAAPSSAEHAPKIVNGVWHLWNEDQEKFFPITSRGAAGEETLEHGETGID